MSIRPLIALLGIVRHLDKLRADRRGIMMGFFLVPVIGALGVGFEISNWYLTTRGMQNAADASAIAAATNGGSNYDVEAKAVAAQYGLLDGSNNVTVTVSNAATCPAGGNTCYSVTISGLVPLFVSQVVGYKGDATLNGGRAKQLSSSAVANKATTPVQYCLLALGSSGTQGITSNGA
jgi:Flp pilus assembly protein TadG